jgi:uncharacterized protein
MTHLIILILVFFVTSAIGVVTGSNSLIAVPVMFEMGIDPRTAVATNMFALVFMAVGGAIPFARQGHIPRRNILPLSALTLVASAAGALLVGYTSDLGIKAVVSVAMIVVALFTLLDRKRKDEPDGAASLSPLVFILTFILGIYGGFFSGGYVTLLTAMLVGVGGMSYRSSIGTTKVINVISSGVATAIFMWQGLVDYRLGLILGVTMFAGAYAGAHYASRWNEELLRRIFVAAVLLLAAKLFYDLITSLI